MPADFISTLPYTVEQPGAYSAVDASQLTSANGALAAPVPVVLGVAQGGKPNTPMYFSSPGRLLATVRGGPAYDVARFMFDGGAPQVGIVRVGNSVAQAVLVLVGTGTIVTLTSIDYGAWNNSIEITVATGPILTLTYTDANGNQYTEQWNLTGLSNALVASAINGGVYGQPKSQFVTAVAGSGTGGLATISATPLAGGSDGTSPASGDWTNGLTALETKQANIVVAAIGDASIHAQVEAHCALMSAPTARMERTQVCGGVLGESVTQVIARQAAIAAARTQLVYPGLNDYNAQGVLTAYDPFYMAGKVAGMRCALPDAATSLVHASMPIVTGEVDLSTIQGGPVDQLLQGGVTPIAPAPGGGYRIVDSITGYNQPDGIFRNVEKVTSADYVSQYARQKLEGKFVGGKGLATAQSSIAAEALQVCTDLQTMQVIAGFKTPTATPGPIIGSWLVTLPVMLIDTTKFIFISVQLQNSSTTVGSTTTADLT